MKSRRFFISLVISLFLHLWLINIFSNILDIHDFREKKEQTMSTINVVFLSADSFPRLKEEIKKQSKFSEEKNLAPSSEGSSINNNSTVLMENDCEGNKVEDNKINKDMLIAKKTQEADREIMPAKEKSMTWQEKDVFNKTKKQERDHLIIDEQNKIDDTQEIHSDLSKSSPSDIGLENKKYVANVTDQPLDLTQSISASEQIIPPKIISFSQPKYPETLRKRGIEGRVQLKVLIDKEGEVVKVEVYDSSGYFNFDEAAVQASFNWCFEAAKSGDTAKDSWVLIPVTFKLE